MQNKKKKMVDRLRVVKTVMEEVPNKDPEEVTTNQEIAVFLGDKFYKEKLHLKMSFWPSEIGKVIPREQLDRDYRWTVGSPGATRHTLQEQIDQDPAELSNRLTSLLDQSYGNGIPLPVFFERRRTVRGMTYTWTPGKGEVIGPQRMSDPKEQSRQRGYSDQIPLVMQLVASIIMGTGAGEFKSSDYRKVEGIPLIMFQIEEPSSASMDFGNRDLFRPQCKQVSIRISLQEPFSLEDKERKIKPIPPNGPAEPEAFLVVSLQVLTCVNKQNKRMYGCPFVHVAVDTEFVGTEWINAQKDPSNAEYRLLNGLIQVRGAIGRKMQDVTVKAGTEDDLLGFIPRTEEEKKWAQKYYATLFVPSGYKQMIDAGIADAKAYPVKRIGQAMAADLCYNLFKENVTTMPANEEEAEKLLGILEMQAGIRPRPKPKQEGKQKEPPKPTEDDNMDRKPAAKKTKRRPQPRRDRHYQVASLMGETDVDLGIRGGEL